MMVDGRSNGKGGQQSYRDALTGFERLGPGRRIGILRTDLDLAHGQHSGNPWNSSMFEARVESRNAAS
jgi:hypothetical protein